MISTGTYQNKGYGDKIRIDIEKKLPQYTHTQLEINPSRLLKQIDKHPNICYGPVGKFPMLLNKFYWSKPLYLMTGYRIIMLPKNHKKLNLLDEVSMNTLLQNKEYTFGQIAGMFHYPVDFEKYKNQQNIHTISSSAPLTHLLRMMRRDRIDWVYDHPVFVKWENIIENNFEEVLATLKVSENKNKPKLTAYIACSKNEFGKKIIQTINTQVKKEDILEYRSYIRKWQLNEETLNSFEKINQDFFGY